MAIATERENSEPLIRLHAEEVSITRHEVAGDTVRVQVVTKTTPHVVDEELRHERVEVTTVPIGKFVDEVPQVREEADTTILPVVEEVIVTERRLLLREEIHVRRVRTTQRHTETVTLRQQEATVTRHKPDQTIPTAGTETPVRVVNPHDNTTILEEQHT